MQRVNAITCESIQDIVFIPPSLQLKMDTLQNEISREKMGYTKTTSVILLSKCGQFEIKNDKMYDITPLIHTSSQSIVECDHIKLFRQQMKYRHNLVSYIPPDFCQFTKEIEQFYYKKNGIHLTIERYDSGTQTIQKTFFTVKNNTIDIKEMSKYLTLFY